MQNNIKKLKKNIGNKKKAPKQKLSDLIYKRKLKDKDI